MGDNSIFGMTVIICLGGGGGEAILEAKEDHEMC